jgi:hypothetical protein
MTIILQFRRAADPVMRVTEPKDRALGQVIIFPGVRIERRAWEEAPSGTASHSRKRAQRGRKKQR